MEADPTNRCTCGGEDSDGRGDVLECVVHGIGPMPVYVEQFFLGAREQDAFEPKRGPRGS